MGLKIIAAKGLSALFTVVSLYQGELELAAGGFGSYIAFNSIDTSDLRKKIYENEKSILERDIGSLKSKLYAMLD